MSRRNNAPYNDRVLDDGITIHYEGHDEPKTIRDADPKKLDQKTKSFKGTLTQNGRFIKAVEDYKSDQSIPELVKVYEKVLPGVWSLKGYFNLIDYSTLNDGHRNVFVFTLRLSENQDIQQNQVIDLKHTRIISSDIKKDVWQRDGGKCVICGSNKNLHFDHDLPFAKGGTSLTSVNIRLLCAKCNLSKSDKIQ